MPQPWKPADATSEIRRLGCSPRLTVTYTEHAKDRMAERDLIVGDVLFIAKRGFVYEDPQAATQAGLYKYKMECETPNSNGRAVRAIFIPDERREHIKLVTLMWVDE